MPKKPASGQGMVSDMRIAASGTDMPTCCASTMRRNSPLTGSGDSLGDQPDAVIERKARLDRAHDDVERIGKFVEERLDAKTSPKRDEPAWQAERAGDERAGQHQQRRAEEEGDDGQRDAADDGIKIEALDGDLHAGLTKLDLSGGFLTLRSLVFCLASRSFNESWTDFRRLAASATRSRDALTTVRSVSAFLTVSRRLPTFLLVGDRIEQKCIGDSPGAEAGEQR